MMNTSTTQKLQRIANRCREAKGWKPGTLFSRAAAANEGSLYVYSVIGATWEGDGITAESVKTALESLKGVKTLNIYINSEGGDVFEAKAIYTQLRRFAGEKVVHVDGLAASAATFIAMAGDKIITSPAATWMVHEAWTFAMGDAQSLRDSADLLDMMNEDIAAIYAAKTGRTCEEMRALMAKETWMNAGQALAEKFTDSIASYDDEPDGDEPAAKTTSRLMSAADATRQRLSAMTADLLAFRAKRTQAESGPPKAPQRTKPTNR